jgi:hypothetical protein
LTGAALHALIVAQIRPCRTCARHGWERSTPERASAREGA